MSPAPATIPPAFRAGSTPRQPAYPGKVARASECGRKANKREVDPPLATFMEGFLMSNHHGFLPPGDRRPWPDAPFELPARELPPRKAQPFGNLDRAAAIVW